MGQLLESLGAFVLMLVFWAIFAWAAATLASFLLEEEIAEFVGSMVVLLGLLAALGIAARIAGKILARSPNSQQERR